MPWQNVNEHEPEIGKFYLVWYTYTSEWCGDQDEFKHGIGWCYRGNDGLEWSIDTYDFMERSCDIKVTHFKELDTPDG